MSRHLIFALIVAVCFIAPGSGMADPTDDVPDFLGGGKGIGGSDSWAVKKSAKSKPDKIRKKGDTSKRSYRKDGGAKASKKRKKGESTPRKTGEKKKRSDRRN